MELRLKPSAPNFCFEPREVFWSERFLDPEIKSKVVVIFFLYHSSIITAVYTETKFGLLAINESKLGLIFFLAKHRRIAVCPPHKFSVWHAHRLALFASSWKFSCMRKRRHLLGLTKKRLLKLCIKL